MNIGAAKHGHKSTNPLTTLLSSSTPTPTKKGQVDADDVAPAKPAATKLATTGPGQVVDRKV